MSKYIVRKSDGSLFHKNEDGTYSHSESQMSTPYKYSKEYLLQGGLFEEAHEEDVPKWAEHNKVYHEYQNWYSRSDGHGGIKGGTFEEFLRRNK